MINLSNSDIIATLASIIAVLAMIATFWQAAISRKHNKLSVKPIIDYTQGRLLDQDIYLSIFNHGLGPAIINKICFTHKNNELRCNQLMDLIFSSIDNKRTSFQTCNLRADTMIAPSQSLELFRISIHSKDEHLYRQIFSILDNYSLVIHYSCIYGSEFIHNVPLNVA